VNDFVAAYAQYRRAEYLVAFRIDQDFHKPLSFTALASTTDSCHWQDADQRVTAGCTNLPFGETEATEGRIDE
jgi:hypothetical protein